MGIELNALHLIYVIFMVLILAFMIMKRDTSLV
ncbi:hypothetical protein HNR33_001960 [Brassicibacter mesophilus]